MSKQKSQKRTSGVVGMKSLIASAAVAATIAGWAILPSNDPQYDTAAAQPIETVGGTTPISQPATATAYPTATATQVPATGFQWAQPSSTPAPAIQATATATTQLTATAEPTAKPTAIPTAIPTTQPAPITRTRSSR
jgi:hypothetical protein